MRNPCQALLLAVLMASLILPPGLPVAGATVSGPASPAKPRSVLLVGDSLSIGLGKQFDAVFAGRPGVRFAHLGKVSSGLANPAFFNWDEQLAAQVKAHHPDLVLIMVGANDDKPLPALGGGQAAFGTKAWDAAYAARLARLHAIVRAENPQAAVAYIGVPVMGDPAFNALMLHVNGVIEKTARSLPDASYIDVEHTLADASGAYAPVARTADGNVVKLRAEDGVHISGTGSRLLAARCLEAVSDAVGLPRRELLAAVDGRDAVPLASAAAPVRLAEAAAPAAKAAPAKAAAAKVEVGKNDAPKAAAVKVEPAKAAPVVVAAARTPAAPAAAKTPAVAAAPEVAKPAPAAAPSAGAYQVADGDTLWSVAKRAGVSADALAAANPGVDARRMSIGQSLALPAGATFAAADKAPAARPEQPAPSARPEQAGRAAGVHVVAEGDNFWNVARRYDVTVAALTAANPNADPTRLRIGQELAVPDAAAAQAAVASAPALDASGQRYVVADGDNLWSIARRLGIDVDRLTQANRAVDPLRLRPGQVLALPGVARADREREAPARKVEEGAVVGDAGLYPVATSTKDSKVNEAILKEKMTHIQSKNDYLKLNSQDTQFIQYFDFINIGNPTKYDQATIRYLQELEGKSSGIPMKLSIDKLQEYPKLQNIIQSRTEYIEHNDILYIQHVESGLVKPKSGRILQEIELYHQDNAQQNTNQNLIKILKTIVEENPNIKVPDSFYTEYLLPKMKQDKKGTQALKEYPDVLFKSIYPYYIK